MYSEATKYQYRQLAIARGKRIGLVSKLMNSFVIDLLLAIFLVSFVTVYFLS